MQYSATAKWLHWVVAALIVGNWWLGSTMVDIVGITPTKLKYFNWHKWAGVVVFTLVCARLSWRWIRRAPPLPDAMPLWQRRVAQATHALLYALMIALPVTGYFDSQASGYPVVVFGMVPLPVLIERDPALHELLASTHEWLGWALVGAFAVHVVAALKHHFVDRDEVLMRMLPRLRRS